MIPIVATKQLTAGSATTIALAQAVAGAGALTLNGASASGGVATLDTQRRVLITSAGNDSGITFTVKGTNQAGAAISETVTGANASSVATLNDFYTITRVTASGAAAGNVSVGTNTVGSTQWFVPDEHITPFEIGATIRVTSGTASASLEYTDELVRSPLQIYQTGQQFSVPTPTPVGWPGMTSIAASAGSVVNHTCQGLRLTVNSGTGQVELVLTQSGIRN